MTRSRGGRRFRWPVLDRMGTSVLIKVLAALLVNLVAAGAVMFVVGTRLTRSALSEQARQVARGQLRILEEAYSERERQMVANLRNLAVTAVAHDLLDPDHRNDLVAELGRTRLFLDLAVLEVVDAHGQPLTPPARAGTGLGGNMPRLPGSVSSETTSQLLPAVDGTFVQAVSVPIGSGTSEYLMGAFHFSDAFAYRLRRQLGDLGHVVLVAHGQVLGSTLPTRSSFAPGHASGAGSPRVVSVAGAESIVASTVVAEVGPGSANVTLAVALPDPVAPLDRSLSRARVLATVVLGLVALLLGWLLFRAVTRPIVTLAATAERIADGDLAASFGARGKDEVGRLASCLERMTAELRAQADRLQESSKRIVAAQDEARRAIARDLHDGVQQELVVLRMRLGLGRELTTGLPPDVAELVDEVGQELDGTIERVRRASQDLYPSILVDRGLTAALHSYVGRLPVAAWLSSSPDPLPRLPPEVESGAYFLVSEAFTNALKHSDAGEIWVSLRLDGPWLIVRVGDDGRGFRPAETQRRGGLLHMEDRVRSFGGELRIDSEPGRGTAIEATFPVRVDDGADTDGDAGARPPAVEREPQPSAP